MSEADKSYGLLSEVSAIEETRNPARQRHLPAQAAFDWLRAGWRDLMIQPGLSLAYGVAVFLVTAFLCLDADRARGGITSCFPPSPAT